MIIFKAKTPQKLFDIQNPDGAILSRWEVSIGEASYNWMTNTATIQLIIQEHNSKFQHSRSFTIPTDGEVTSNDIVVEVGEFLGSNFEIIPSQ